MKSTYTLIVSLLVTILFAGSASAQKRVDVIITTDNDTIYGIIHAELYGMIQYYPEGDYKLKTIDYRNINRIILNKYNPVYLSHIVDKDGYVRSNYKPSGSQRVTEQQDYPPQNLKSDSLLFSDSAIVAMLTATGKELVAFHDEFYTGQKLVDIGSGISLGGVILGCAIMIADPALLIVGGVIIGAAALTGTIIAVIGSNIIRNSYKRAGQAGKILQGAEKFYFPHVME